uniref:Very long-chain specific acyl-CoA dehydrogenase, mitochondrial n=1 Tax=Syphacia muris TaxID=451379 RepID=A0A0N5AJS3_9BILA
MESEFGNEFLCKFPITYSLIESESFVKKLFIGQSDVKNIFPYPLNLSDEQKELLGVLLPSTEKFFTEINNPVENDEKAEISMEVLKHFADFGGFGVLVPEKYGGAGMCNTQMARFGEQIGANDLAFGVIMGAHQSIGYKGILLYGDDKMKQKYLPDLAAGKRFACFCLTEPSSGSDANSIRTRAEKTPDGKYYIINGAKIWISNGGIADIFTVFAQTQIETADGKTKDRISAFLVEKNFGGVTCGLPEKKMGIKGSNTTSVYFENTKVPAENLIGREGEGFKVAMNILNNGRFSIPAACTGAMKTCIIKTIQHVTTRSQFGRKLIEFGNVKEQIVDMIVRHYATESVLYLLSSNMDRGVTDYQLEAAIGKIMASENAWIVCDKAIQLHGGMGYMKECGLERIMRDLRVFRLFEGANDVLRLYIVLSGMQFAGKHFQYLKKQMKSGAISAIFSEFARRFFGFDIIFLEGDLRTNIGTDIAIVVHPLLIDSAKQVNTAIKEYGKAVERLLITHRRNIIDRQYELIRMADAAVDIFSMTAVLARCTMALNGKTNADDEHKIPVLLCEQASLIAIISVQNNAVMTLSKFRTLPGIND